MDVRKCFPSKHLEATDLNGEVHTLAIMRVSIEEVGKQKEARPAVWFHGIAKAMILNKTNANTIAAMYGFETDGWIGKQIAIFPTETEFGGKMVSCIRVNTDLPAIATANSPSVLPATPTTIAAETVRQEGSLEAAATHLEPRINATEASGSTTAQDNPASGLQVDLGAILRGQ